MKSAKLKTTSIHSRDWNHERLGTLVWGLSEKKILIVGDVGVDRYTIGAVERISPEAPVPIVLVQEEQLKLGLAANVADNVRALAAVPFLVGVVGGDRCAQDFRGLLRKQKVSAAYLIGDVSRRTVLKERIVSDRQQLLRVDYETLEPVTAGIEKEILSRVAALLPKVDAVILQDYAKGMMSERLIQGILRLAKRARKPVAVDPNTKTPVEYYRGAFVLTPNTKEAEKLSGMAIVDENSLKQAGLRLLEVTHAPYVVITRGKDGMAIFSKAEREMTLIPTYVREVYDVSGAGDTVISVMTLALAAQASVQEASILGNLAAGVEVGKRGTATVSQQEILSALEFFSTVGV